MKNGSEKETLVFLAVVDVDVDVVVDVVVVVVVSVSFVYYAFFQGVRLKMTSNWLSFFSSSAEG